MLSPFSFDPNAGLANPGHVWYNRLKKRRRDPMRTYLKLSLLFLALVLILSMAGCGNTEPDVTQALLYTVSGVELEFNVTHSAPLHPDVTVEGWGIATLSDLQEIMGIPDAPTPNPGEIAERTLGKAVTADLYLNEAGQVAAIEVQDIAQRPVIGISWKKETVGDDYKGFAEAFERNGAYAVFLPRVSTEAEAQAVLDAIDGIFMTGGADIEPVHYGQSPEPHGSAKWNTDRDTSDLLLIRRAIAMDLPLLGVCRGAQALNTALGGSLIQDVPLYLGQQVLDGQIDPRRVTAVLSGTLPDGSISVPDDDCEEEHLRVEVDGLCHRGGLKYHALEDGIDPDSKWLADIIGGTNISSIATAHHQSIDPTALGNGLTIAARSSDGIVEAVEYRDNLFAMGLQWHPERDALGDSSEVDVDQNLSNALLRALVTHAGIYHRLN